LIDWLIESIDQSTFNWLIDQLIDHSINQQLFDRLIGQSIKQLLIDWSANQSIDRLIDQIWSIDQFNIDRLIDRIWSIDQFDQSTINWLIDQSFDHLKNKKIKNLAFKVLSFVRGMNNGTLSHTLPFFAIYDFCYVVEKLKSSVCVWLFVKLNQETLS